jgi:hypothetical protein
MGPTDDPNQGIYTGDARILSEQIPDESVDLIFTDPIYDRIDDYRWLAETAARVLKPDRACLVWIGIGHMFRVLRAMCCYLTYRWTLDLVLVGTPLFYGRLGCKTQRCLWFDKGYFLPHKMIFDSTTINAYNKPKTNRKLWKDSMRGESKARGYKTDWGKDVRANSRYIDAFLVNGGVGVDFFTGGGTVPAVCKMLGRHWLAFEIDPATADTARERIYNTKVPLFVPEPEQTAMEF